MLRQFPQNLYEPLKKGGNVFATTIFVLVSAVQQIARAVRIREGTLLYRGLGGLMELPEIFFSADKCGRRGYTEWGFLSTTSNKSVAIQYSGVRDGRPSAMVLVLESSAIDRGACIHNFSQYPTVLTHPFHVTILHFSCANCVCPTRVNSTAVIMRTPTSCLRNRDM